MLVHLIDDIRKADWAPGSGGVRFKQALTQVDGTYGMALVSKEGGEDLLIGARKGSPLLIGVGEDELVPLRMRLHWSSTRVRSSTSTTARWS